MTMDSVSIPVLMYHSVAWHAAPRFRPFSVTPAEFTNQMSYLAERGYTPITVSALAAAVAGRGPHLPLRPVVLTFDDGFADFHTHALPVLRRQGFQATLYIVTQFVGGTSRWLQPEGEGARLMLNWEQIREIHAAGIECGAHSHSHPQLDTLPAAAANHEITRSKALLEDQLQQPILSFAYPFGYYTSSIKRLVQAAGFTSACAVRYDLSSTRDDPFALARLIVKPGLSLDDFGRLLTTAKPGLLRGARRAMTWGWRLVRRSIGYFGRVDGLFREKSAA